MPQSANGSASRIVSSPSRTRTWLFPSTARVSTQALWISTTFSECANSPSAQSPLWLTRSISVKPGAATSQRSVFSGM